MRTPRRNHPRSLSIPRQVGAVSLRQVRAGDDTTPQASHTRPLTGLYENGVTSAGRQRRRDDGYDW